ncbi:hypothetical protein [Variovorax sp. UMC13]|uniref:hypothetical protein n=1 Tax=Variovorax sp. UMC13 TaxID=1862326 RepID=UPI0015FF093A|nr:hypothetical protein [Variovorax sp. UMC13]MBB1601288.1 hypothetical protein [Variovorax sp. UMC13]
MKRSALLCALLLAGCASTSHQVKVPMPIECRVDEPARPAMPSDALTPGVALDRFVAVLTAEIEIREGYEGELLAALRSCTAPLVAQ